MRRQREEVERKAVAARQQVAAAVKKKADKQYREELAQAQRDAAVAEKASLDAALKKAEQDRQKTLADAREQAGKATAAALAKAEQQSDLEARKILERAAKAADERRKRELAQANDQAAEIYSKSMADAEKAAELMRQRMMEVARMNADKRLQETLSEAKRKADEQAEAQIAQARSEADEKKSAALAAAEKRIKSEEATRIEAVEKEARRAYEAAVARARKESEKERQRVLAEAAGAAEAARKKQIATIAPNAAESPAGPNTLSDAELGLGPDVPPELRRRIDAAMADARKKGQGRAGEVRAALQAIKRFRQSESAKPSTATAAKGTPATPLDVAVATPELKEIIEIAMKRARGEGKNYQGQVQAALNAVKVYRERETKDEKSPDPGNAQTSALLLGQSKTDPELRRIINEAMAQARSRGKDYPAQVRAALSAIKAHRARTVGTGTK